MCIWRSSDIEYVSSFHLLELSCAVLTVILWIFGVTLILLTGSQFLIYSIIFNRYYLNT